MNLKPSHTYRFKDYSNKNLFDMDLHGCDFHGAVFCNADLSYCNLSGATLSYADMTGANLSRANLTGANLRGAFLRNCNLHNTILLDVNLRGVSGIISPVDFMRANFNRNDAGEWVVYKKMFARSDTFYEGGHDAAYSGMVITEPGVNWNRQDMNGSGIRVATLPFWEGDTSVWECIIPRDYACTIVVPIGSNGLIRVACVMLVREVS